MYTMIQKFEGGPGMEYFMNQPSNFWSVMLEEGA